MTVRLVFLFAALLAAIPLAAQDAPVNAALSAEVAELRSMVLKLQARIDEMEARSASPQPGSPVAAPTPVTAAPSSVVSVAAPSTAPDFLHGTTVNFLFDGYYGFNFNQPIGRDNLLRAYDVSSNSFSLSQAAVVLENAPDPDKGKRYGARLDLQFGQATQTLQGNPANEPRPDIYRNIFQVYGTYVFPVGKGLTVDFGKWASSLGVEGNYNKDQMNYSRAFLFSFLPFYHTGARVNLKLNDQATFNYWAVNGTQQTEAFNNFKDQLFGLTLAPSKSVTWNFNYYLGQENPDTVYYQNNAASNAPPAAPSIQGTAFTPIVNAPKGKLHIFDSYVAWQATPKLNLVLEGDYVINRIRTDSAPAHVAAGAVYTRYQIKPKVALAARAEYFSDRGGLFTGTTQALKEFTFTSEYKFAEGFLARAEYRRDFSNQPYFLTDVLGRLKKEQNTATLGLIWWFGQKTGTW